MQVGELRDIEELWMQRYFDFVSRGTVAEGAKLTISRCPVTMQCDSCGRTAPVDIRTMSKFACSSCGGETAKIKSGRELSVEQIGII